MRSSNINPQELTLRDDSSDGRYFIDKLRMMLFKDRMNVISAYHILNSQISFRCFYIFFSCTSSRIDRKVTRPSSISALLSGSSKGQMVFLTYFSFVFSIKLLRALKKGFSILLLILFRPGYNEAFVIQLCFIFTKLSLLLSTGTSYRYRKSDRLAPLNELLRSVLTFPLVLVGLIDQGVFTMGSFMLQAFTNLSESLLIKSLFYNRCISDKSSYSNTESNSHSDKK